MSNLRQPKFMMYCWDSKYAKELYCKYFQPNWTREETWNCRTKYAKQVYFVNQSLQLIDSFPLEDITPDRTVKLDNHTKLTLNLNYFRNYICKINVILGVIKEKARSKNTFHCLIAVQWNFHLLKMSVFLLLNIISCWFQEIEFN